MNDRMRAAVSWSGGKDSAICLARAVQNPELQVLSLFTTYSSDTGILAIRGVPMPLIREQAKRLNIELIAVGIPERCTDSKYEQLVLSALAKHQIEAMVFSDIFLSDVRKYRERFLGDAGIQTVFPLFGEKTFNLSKEVARRGYKARVCSVDKTQLSASFCGLEYDAEFLRQLPNYVDPCGENGEFHTFVYDGPGFSSPMTFNSPATYEDDRFIYLRMRL